MSSGAPSAHDGERRRGQQAIEPHDQCLTVRRREERVEIEHAELADRWIEDLGEQRWEVEVVCRRPSTGDQVGHEDVLPPRERIALDADEAEQTGDGGVDLVVAGARVVGRGGPVRRPSTSSGTPAFGAGGVDDGVGGFGQLGNVGAVEVPAGQTVLPDRRSLVGEVGRPWSPRPERRPRPSTARTVWCAATGNVRHRLPRSPLGSMASTGTPDRRVSSSNTMPRPVLPEPVMPTMTPWVVKSALSSSTASPLRSPLLGSSPSPMKSLPFVVPCRPGWHDSGELRRIPDE